MATIATTAPERLLAKTPAAGRLPVSLADHLRDTEMAATLIFDGEQRAYHNWLRFFRIPAERDARFLLNLRAACLFHDIGKANVDFFERCARISLERQTIRHEHLSALILHLPAVRSWLAENAELDLEIITAAVLTHHLKASDRRNDAYLWCQASRPTPLRLFLDHPEVRAVFERVQKLADLAGPPDLPDDPWSVNSEFWKQVRIDGGHTAREFGRQVASGYNGRPKDELRSNLLGAVKAGLIAADSVASALIRADRPMAEWLGEVLHQPAFAPGQIKSEIIEPRGRQLERSRGQPFKPKSFQTRLAFKGPRALLLAGCGAGKTIAAYYWADAMAAQVSIGRVIFLYPTRGTATEGFRDYAAWAPEGSAELLHGTARYELEEMRENPPESLDGKRLERDESLERLYALQHWSGRYFSATVDQFLGFIENSYSSLILLPILADSAVIFDEIHAYDQRMFNRLNTFLRRFDVPVLCMTATLPPVRQEALLSIGFSLYPDDEDRAALKANDEATSPAASATSLSKSESRARYTIRWIADAQEALAIAECAYRSTDRHRVLWVLNTVARCQQAALWLGEREAREILAYHSRFRLQDRQNRHSAVVSRFAYAEHTRPVIAVTTQVCEMSLDLDADSLITELAPIPALVQRFGRANRHGARGPDFRAEVFVYDPQSHAPYDSAELDAARAFLVELDGKEVSQELLAELLLKHSAPELAPGTGASFLDGGYYAVRGDLREIEEYAQPCILDGDIETVLERLRRREPIDGFVVPVPRRFTLNKQETPPGLPRYLGLAESARYSELLGFMTEDAG